MDKETYARFVREHHTKVFRLCSGLLGRASEADDAAQDIFVKAYEKMSGFKGQSSLSRLKRTKSKRSK